MLVVASAVGIYGDRGDEILTEESAAGAGFLADVVRAWEAAADPAREAGIRVVHLRQGIVLSKDGGALKPMLLPFKLGVGGRVGSGKQWWSWIGIDDLVASYAHVLEGDLAGAVNATAPNPATNEQFTKALGSALHRPTVLPVPAFAARTLFGEMGDAMLLGGQRVLPARLVEARLRLLHADDRRRPRARAHGRVGTRHRPSATMGACRNSRRSAGTTPGAPRSSRTPSRDSCRDASRCSIAASTTW